jgi:MFS family permease
MPERDLSEPRGWARHAPALRHRNFRRYFAGQAVSVLGGWIQTVAMSWVVYRLTGSAALLGFTAFLSQAPQLLIAPLAGVWIDRHDRRRMLLVVQGLHMVQALALAGLSFAGALQPWHLVALAAVQGVLNSFDTPLRQSLLAHFVADRRDLQSAVALNASVFTAGRFVGPPVAGLLLGLTTEALCFLLNAVSYLALVAAVLTMHLGDTRSHDARATSMAAALRAGLAFAWATPPIRTVLISLAILNATASSAIVLMPIFAKEIFLGDARTLGWLLGAAGAGAVSATALLAGRRPLERIARLVWMGWIPGGAGLAGLCLVHRVELALPMMFLLGAGIAMTNVSTNALLQSLTPDALRGRVISLFAALRFGMDAVGGLVAGLIAHSLGPVATVLIEAALLFAALIWLAPRLRALRRQVG